MGNKIKLRGTVDWNIDINIELSHFHINIIPISSQFNNAVVDGIHYICRSLSLCRSFAIKDITN